jgi:membrane protease YdiL (CAAX protease family)
MALLVTLFSRTLSTSLLIYTIILVISLFFYYSKDYERYLIGFSTKNIGKILTWTGILGVVIYMVIKYLPGGSILLPYMPGQLSDDFNAIIFPILFAPIIEEIFFRGALMGFVRKFKPDKSGIWIAIIISALAFSLFHLARYTGLGDLGTLPNIGYLISAFSSNIVPFLFAFIFGIVAGWFVTRDGVRNLLFVILLHFLWNLFAYIIPMIHNGAV